MGKSTGLGLSITHGIVSSHGGLITCASTLEQGTVFHVSIPELLTPSVADDQRTEEVPTGSGNILFLDDEELLVDMGRLLLERLGYQVTPFTEAAQAIAAFRSDPDRFDAVITDLTMPGMTGIEVARELLALRPELPIVLCTGYSHLFDEQQAQSLGITAFAMKPLTKRELAELLQQVLADQRSKSISPKAISKR